MSMTLDDDEEISESHTCSMCDDERELCDEIGCQKPHFCSDLCAQRYREWRDAVQA